MKKFVASYSGGKDSALAVHRAILLGMEPMALMTTYDADAGRSWFHGIPEALLRDVGEALGVPARLIVTSGETYARSFEAALRDAHEMGASACVFGDIDIEEHRQWCAQRCDAAGLEAVFPLWGQPRAQLVSSLIDAGFCARITVVDTRWIPATFLGLDLTHEIAERIAATGADVCGENGEYHTFVYDGPTFSRQAAFAPGAVVCKGSYAILPVHPAT